MDPISSSRLDFTRAEFLAIDVHDFFGRPGSSVPRVHPHSGGDEPPRQVATSVLVNTYNHERFIEECIDSLLVQTVVPDEIIVYDDGSSDGTVARLRRYGSRIRLIEGKGREGPSHLRQARAIERAFAESTGRLIFFLDGDDRFKRTKIQRYSAVFAANQDAALIQAPMDKIDEHSRMLGSYVESRRHVVEHLKEIYRLQDVDFFYPTSALAFSRSYLECVIPIDFSEGCPLWLDTRLSIIAPYFGRVITLPDILTDWRRHSGSDSLRRRSRHLQIRQTLMRTRVFNAFCRRHGLRTISPWRNRRFYLQLLRYTLPERAYSLVHRRVRQRAAPQF